MKRLFFLLLFLSLATGCSMVKSIMPNSSPSTPGEQMLSQSKQTKTLGKTWNQGQQMLEKGQKLLSKSDKLRLESQQTRTEAEGLIAQGNTLIANSEQGYKAAFGETEDMPGTSNSIPTEASARSQLMR